jgi:hypothetical protein
MQFPEIAVTGAGVLLFWGHLGIKADLLFCNKPQFQYPVLLNFMVLEKECQITVDFARPGRLYPQIFSID